MTGAQALIELPERDTYGEIMKGYLTLMRAFGRELASVCDGTLSPQLGNWWFQTLMQQRIAEKKIRGQQQDLQDPIIVLNEIGREYISPIHLALPRSAEAVSGAKMIVAKRNELLHFGTEPSLDDIGEVARLIQLFARHYNLATDGAVVPLLTRLQRIKRGQHRGIPEPQPPTAQAPPAVVPTSEPDVVAVNTDRVPRPKIGGVWQGAIPAADLKVTKTGDLVSVQTGVSIKDRLAGDVASKLRAWLAPHPKGNLWADDDGAVGGFVAAVPRLLGYIGDEPPGEVARGFLYPRYYEVAAHAVRDLESGIVHDLPMDVPVVDGEVLRLTTYGDLIRIDDDGVSRVAIVNPTDWA